MTPSPCPYLGQPADPDTVHLQPHAGHRCYATDPAGSIDLAHQLRHCYADAAGCPRFIPLTANGRRATPHSDLAGLALGAAAAGALVGTTGQPSAASPGSAITTSPTVHPVHSVHTTPARPANPGTPAAPTSPRLRAWLSRLSFEEWLVYAVTGGLVAVIAYFAFVAGPTAPATPAPAAGSKMAEAVAALQATATPTAPPHPSPTSRSTRAPDLGPPATAPVPTPASGGLIAALSPSERGVGVFNPIDRVPEFGDRNLRVGHFDDREYMGGILFPLSKLPKGSRVSYVALELAGLSDTNLSGEGTWTVEMLDPEAADGWSNLTFDTLSAAPAAQMKTAWQIPSADLAARKVNVMAFSDEARDLFMQRLDQGKIAFRIRGPQKAGGDGEPEGIAVGDNLFTWDTGYGQGFGTRPVLRVAFVPPPPTPGPPPGQAAEPTPVPLIVWVAEPTPAATATPLPGEVPGALGGMILFLSDRFGKTSLMVYDPADGRIGQVTQSWPYGVAQQREASAGGLTVRVENRPCGGQTIRRDGVDVLVDPDDPARQCAQLIVTDPATAAGAPREITEPGHMHYNPALSPDGQWIAYTSTISDNDEIYKMRPDGSENTRLTENLWEWDKHPSWSPDGTQIVFWSNRDGKNQLYLMNADGSGVRKLSANSFNDWDPVWVK